MYYSTLYLYMYCYEFIVIYYFLDESYTDENEVTWETNEGEKHENTFTE